eukprot:3938723-Rhodomonas_salina.3
MAASLFCVTTTALRPYKTCHGQYPAHYQLRTPVQRQERYSSTAQKYALDASVGLRRQHACRLPPWLETVTSLFRRNRPVTCPQFPLPHSVPGDLSPLPPLVPAPTCLN